MALSFTEYEASSTTNNTTLSITGVTAAVDARIFVFGTGDQLNNFTCSDAKGHTYTLLGNSGTSDLLQRIYYTKVTSALSSNAITLTWNNNVRHKSAIVLVVTSPSGVSIRGGPVATVGTVFSSYTTDSITSGDTTICVLSHSGSNASGADSDTTNGTWSSLYTVGSTRSTGLQWKTTTGTGTQTWNPTGVSADNFVARNINIYENVSTGYTLDSGLGEYLVSGEDAELAYGRIFVADTASYSTVGTSATLIYAKGIGADSGVYVVTGTDATLTKAGVPTGQTLDAVGGTYSHGGLDVTFNYNHILSSALGAYTVSGEAADIRRGKTVVADTAAYSVSGTAASFKYTYVLDAATNFYTVDGMVSNYLRGYAVSAASGSYSVVGTDATFQKGQRRIDADSGVYSISGKSAALYLTLTTPLRGLDPQYKFWNSPDGMHTVYPTFIDFLSYVKRPHNTNGNGNLIVTTDAGTGLMDAHGHIRVTVVSGTSYVGMFASDGSLNVLVVDRNDEEPDQKFDSFSGAMRVVRAETSDRGMIHPNNGAVYVSNLP